MDQKGITLIELLIVMSLSTVIIGGIYTIYTSQQKTLKREEEKIRMNQKVRTSMNKIIRYLRNSGVDPTDTLSQGSTVGIISADTTSISLLSDLNGNGDTVDSNESITFTYNAGTEEIDMNSSIIANQIINFSLTYYDFSGNLLATPLIPADRTAIRKIMISIEARTASEHSIYKSGWDLNGNTADGTCYTKTLTSTILPVNIGIF